MNEHSTFNIERPKLHALADVVPWMLGVECSMLNVSNFPSEAATTPAAQKSYEC
jgi:hypothetical protein